MTPKTPSRGYVEAWEVESLTDSAKVYTVSKRKDGTLACSCPAWKFAHAPKPDCKHIRALRSDLITAPTTLAAKLVTVLFDGAVVARITQAQADRLRAQLPGMQPEPATVISSEFRIRRKFRFDEE